MSLQERLRRVSLIIRTKNYPLKDLIPLLQEAADKLDFHEASIEDFYDEEWFDKE